MDKMEQLWNYMQEDIKADKIDTEIRRSPLRQKLEKTRDFIMDQQKLYKEMEERVSISIDRKDGIVDALKRSEEQLRALQERGTSCCLPGCRKPHRSVAWSRGFGSRGLQPGSGRLP